MSHDRLELEVTREVHLLFKVIDARYKQNKSMIFTTNVEKEDWGIAWETRYLQQPF